MNQPNYREFYPKSLIPIGNNDRNALRSFQNLVDESFQATHWLIALQGSVKQLPDEYYHWQVCLYPTDLEGTYSWNKPYFISNFINSIDEAIEFSRELEIYGRDDAIISSNLQEKIS